MIRSLLSLLRPVGASIALALPALALGAGPAPDRAQCDAGHETPLQVAPLLPEAWRGASAAWLDDRHLRWAGAAVEGRYALLHSSRGALQLAPGAAARGVDRRFALEPASVPASVSGDRLARFSHIGAGATLALRASRAELSALHRGQTLLVREDAQGRVLAATALQVAGALDALYAGADAVDDLGAHVVRGRSGFKLWAPTARRVALCLYGRGERGDLGEGRAVALHAMQRDPRSGVWSHAVAADLRGHHYDYLVEVFVRGKGWVRNRVTDPYSLSLNTDSQRSVVVDLDDPALEPPGWRTKPAPQRVAAPTDLVIYELHVRDFSVGDASVSAAHRGKYLAFTEAGSLGMKHLKRLADAGVTDVHLLPVFDIASVPERGCTTPAVPAAAPDSELQQAAATAGAAADCFNWGYDPWHFTAPEGSYATDAADGAARIREFRAMVQALHVAGLRVGMDMVYNHTSAAGQDPKSVLDRIVPGYYHRLNAQGAIERSTCCENTATEHRMMAKLMIDSTVVWARDHKIDSMRFDLMGHQPREAMERLQRAVNRASGRRIDLIGEGWNFGEVENGKRFVQASQKSLNGSGIGTFSDRGRDAARASSWGSPEETRSNTGWIHGAGTAQQADLLRVGLAGTLENFTMTDRNGQRVPLARIDYGGQGAGYASQPAEVVNYVENHDNQTLFDNIVTKMPPATSREDRARVQTLGAALVAFSQGIAYFHAGQEILRSKSLDRNSYDSGDAFNRLDWTLEDNGFGTGLPPSRDNQDHWPVMRPLLAAADTLKPTRTEITWARDAFLDLLKVRASSTLFRLRTADEVQRRLTFFNIGPTMNPSVVVGHLDGAGHPGANFRELLYLINASPQAQTLTIEALKGRPFELHPVHRAADAADRRPLNEASYLAERGSFNVPARTALVYVVP